MKTKILFLSLLATGCLFTASCSDDDDNNTAVSGITVTQAETSFTAKGGQNTISVSEDVVQAYAADEWLTVNADGKIVSITAPVNTESQSRHTTVVIKASATDSTVVNVSQYGSVFVLDATDIAMKTDAATTRTFSLKADQPVEVSTSDDWIKATVTDDALVVSLDANTTGHVRTGKIFYSCGQISGELNVSQYEFAKDILGDYLFYGYRPDQSGLTALRAELTGTASNLKIVFPAVNLELPVTWNADEMSLTFTAGKYMGTYDDEVSSTDPTIVTRYVWSMLWDQTSGYITWSATAGMSGTFYYNEEIDRTCLDFEDNGSWGTYSATTFRMGYFTSATTCSSATRVTKGYTYLWAALFPGLQSVPESSAAKEIANVPASIRKAAPASTKGQKLTMLEIEE